MSLLRWKDRAKRRTDLGESINLVRKTIKDKNIADEMGQVGFEKMFQPITKGLSKITPKFKDDFVYEQRQPGYQTVFDYSLPQDAGDEKDVLNVGIADDVDDENYEIFDGLDLIKEIPEGEFSKETGYEWELKDAKDAKDAEDEEDEFFSLLPEGSPVPPQREKQMPASPSPFSEEGAVGGPPPEYEQGEYLKSKEQEALEEKRVLKELGLPLPTERSKDQVVAIYNAKIKEMGIAKQTLSRLTKASHPSEREKLKEERQKLDKQSAIVTKLRDEVKKKGMGIRRRNGRSLNPLMNKLAVILGEIEAGNNSREMKKMGRAILEILAGMEVALDFQKIIKML